MDCRDERRKVRHVFLLSCGTWLHCGCGARGCTLRHRTGDDEIDVATAIPLVNNFCVEWPSSSRSQRIFNKFISSSDLILLTRQWEKFVFVVCRVYIPIWQVDVKNINLLKTKRRLLYLWPSPYRAVNTFHLGYKNQSVYAVSGTSRCLFSDNHLKTKRRLLYLTLRRLMSYIYIYIYIYGAPILDVSRSHTTTQHSR